MSSDDLDEVQKRVNDSRDLFLAENDAAEDGHKSTTNFLSKLLSPEAGRSEITHEETNEAIRLIDGFTTVRVSFVCKVALANLKMASAINSLMVRDLDELFKNLSSGASDETSTMDSIKALLEHAAVFDRAQKEFAKRAEAGKKQISAIGNHVVHLHILAARLLQVRKLTLQDFADTNLAKTWTESLETFLAESEAAGIEIALDKGWEAFWEIAVEIGNLHLPFWVKIFTPGYIKKVQEITAKAIGKREVNFAYGAVDLMQHLLVILRKEKALFETLDTAYKDAMSEMEAVSTPRKAM
jgi:hypothetical protein